MGGRTKKAAKKAATPVVISAKLTAEWPLKGKDTESLLLEINQLQETINAADLAGKKELDKLGGEDEELTQELEGMNPGLRQRPQPGAAGNGRLHAGQQDRAARTRRLWPTHSRKPKPRPKKSPRPPAPDSAHSVNSVHSSSRVAILITTETNGKLTTTSSCRPIAGACAGQRLRVGVRGARISARRSQLPRDRHRRVRSQAVTVNAAACAGG